MDRTTFISTLQVNLGRGREATALAQGFAAERGIQVVLVQEPFHDTGSWNAKGRVFSPSADAKVLTVITDNSLEAVLLPQFSSRTVVVVRLSNIVLVNVYAEPGGGFDRLLERVGAVCRQ